MERHRDRVKVITDYATEAMAHVTSRTKLSELKARLRAATGRQENGAARLVRSVQQSLRVEGYEVPEEVLYAALRRTSARHSP